MKGKIKVVLWVLVLAGLVGILVRYLSTTDITLLNPKGQIAEKERNLIILSLALSLIVVLPVLALTFGFAWRYRESNHKAKYSPDLDHSVIAETTWWLIPSALIAVLAVITWTSTHSLDPFKPITSSTKPITIQVVALNWKWLFIYPDQNIATVNYVQFPKQTPINFEVTADAPMNSFWIPRLGGQIYAMPGMSTQLHLIATNTGEYRGSSANISGEGFSGMTFMARSLTQKDFNKWVSSIKNSKNDLDTSKYTALSKPSQNNPTAYYSLSENNLYNSIMSKYMPYSMDSSDEHSHGAENL